MHVPLFKQGIVVQGLFDGLIKDSPISANLVHFVL